MRRRAAGPGFRLAPQAEPLQSNSTFTPVSRKKNAPSQRGEGARALLGCLSNGTKSYRTLMPLLEANPQYEITQLQLVTAL